MTEITVRTTPGLALIEKQPAETRRYLIGFSRVLTGGEAVQSVAVECDSAVSCSTAHATAYATLIVTGGTHGSTLPIRVTVTGSLGSICVQCLRLTVTDPLDGQVATIATPDGGDFDSTPTGTLDGGTFE